MGLSLQACTLGSLGWRGAPGVPYATGAALEGHSPQRLVI